MIASLIASSILLTGSLAAPTAIEPQTTAAPTKSSHPWYVKAVSDQVVNYCCIAGMWDKVADWGGPARGIHTAAATLSFSSFVTETYQSNTVTTLFTTVPGHVVTVYGPGGAVSTSTAQPATYTSVLTPSKGASGTIGVVTGTFSLSTDGASATGSPTDSIDTSAPTATGAGSDSDSSGADSSDASSAPTPAATSTQHKGLLGEIQQVESYAHALAEAIIAPTQMTKMLSSAYVAVMEHGYVHASQAVELVSQASDAFGALRTDPAYASQSKRLAAQPTPINFKKAVAKATQAHSAGLQKLLAEPSGKKAYSNAKKLGEEFVKAFVRE